MTEKLRMSPLIASADPEKLAATLASEIVYALATLPKLSPRQEVGQAGAAIHAAILGYLTTGKPAAQRTPDSRNTVIGLKNLKDETLDRIVAEAAALANTQKPKAASKTVLGLKLKD